MADQKVKMAVKKAKVNMKKRAEMASECDPCGAPSIPKDPRLFVSADEVANGFKVHMNGEEFVAKDKKEVLSIIDEILS